MKKFKKSAYRYEPYWMTALYAAFFLVVIWGIYFTFPSQILELRTAPLDKVGSFLSGIFAFLAFVALFFQLMISVAKESVERVKENDDKLRKEKLAQPILRIEDINYFYEKKDFNSYNPVNSTYSAYIACNLIIFEIINIGKEAREINIEIISHDYKHSFKTADHLPYSKKLKIEEDIPKIQKNSQSIEIKIIYLDINNELNFTTFRSDLLIDTIDKKLYSKKITSSSSLD
ncbi:hypothetical protein [Marinomonas spartinae]|uniref:hypothetical protein n=1 Tax=Marinomonas spartinae TaxID=1792290 RepID=UPI0018F1AE15|nr:hypothetical protein [Marinomonas spartinae]MBJ7556543.1 hypothetical protein [Marinomonas spartinae]